MHELLVSIPRLVSPEERRGSSVLYRIYAPENQTQTKGDVDPPI